MGFDAHSRTPTIILQGFETHVKPKTNFRVARIYFRDYKQKPEEATDFVARCRIQAKKLLQIN